MFILREIFTSDNLLHTFLGFLLMAVLWGLSFDPDWQAADWPTYARFAALFLYLREVGQVQAKAHNNNFLKGWSLRGNRPEKALHRHMEWIVPSAVINGVTLTIMS